MVFPRGWVPFSGLLVINCQVLLDVVKAAPSLQSGPARFPHHPRVRMARGVEVVNRVVLTP